MRIQGDHLSARRGLAIGVKAGTGTSQETTPDPGSAGMQAALRDAEQFLLRTGSIHPDLTAQTLLRCLRRYRAHLYAVVKASQQPDSLGT